MAWVAVIAGLVLLVAGAELIVRSGSRLAARLGVPPILVGLTVVSIGTSAPELAVGIGAAASGAGSLAVGNIAGTNIVNLLLILGLTAALRAIPLSMQTLRLDLPVMGVVAMVVFLFAIDGELTRTEGAILVGLAIGYTVALVRTARRETTYIAEEFADAFGPRSFSRSRWATLGAVVVLAAGLGVVILGADWLVDGSIEIARSLGISEGFIGLTIIAIGTSAPELVTAILSTFRGERDIAIGNLIGSSTFNLTLILGITVLAAPIVLDPALILVDIPVMILATLFVGVLMLTGRRIGRREGALMVVFYLAYLAYLVLVRL